MSVTIHSSLPASNKVVVQSRVHATVDDQHAQEYQRGHEDGSTWASDYATPDELRELVDNFGSIRGGDFDNSHWQGFIAGAADVLDSMLQC